ncbi:tRNA (cytosine(34)-C(5))-methyltransferase [Entophlyctis luteolus]|nr:tRNA (cytosine(34)-C(5))-methyltransferase [Entophlyctis luteolus]
MGKRGSGGFRRGRGRGGRDRSRRERDTQQHDENGYVSIPTENDKFDAYYRAQDLMSPDEWTQTLEILKTGLPTNFRFTGSKSNAAKILELMKKNYFPSLNGIVLDGEQVPPPSPLPWYPNNFGWQYKATRSQIRNHEGISKFHEFLMAETDAGNVSRQEAVSMIPPLFLDVKPGHYVLDMCAAPGSKTAQLIEAVNSNDELLPSGLVVANDADYKRAYMLVKQSKRLQSPNLVVTNHEAQFLPYIHFKSRDDLSEGERVLQFDRTTGNALTKVQLAILLRAVDFSKVGGRIVYSTCTFNPVENEAVVAGALNACGASLKLLDVSADLKLLKRRPGVSKWKVMDPDGAFHEKYETVPEAFRGRKVFEESFAPSNVDELGLEKCLRILPGDQDTGAFFVAVFEKVAPYGGLDNKAGHTSADIVASAKRKVDDDAQEERFVTVHLIQLTRSSDSKRIFVEEEDSHDKSKAAWMGKGEEPFIFVPSDHKDIQDIVKFYDINTSFPTDQIVVRSENESFKALYFVSASVKRLLNAKNSSKLKIVNTGVRTFTRTSQTGGQKDAFLYRVTSEGLATLASFLSSKRKVEVSHEDVKILLEKEYPLVTEMSDQLQNAVATLAPGSFVLRYTPHEDGHTGSLHETIFLPAMRAAVSVSLLVPKEERKSLQSRIFGAHFATETGLKKDSNKAPIAADDEEENEDDS